MVITSTIGNRVVAMSGTWVQIPPSPPRKPNQKDIMSIWSAAKRVCGIFANPFSYSILRDIYLCFEGFELWLRQKTEKTMVSV